MIEYVLCFVVVILIMFKVLKKAIEFLRDCVLRLWRFKGRSMKVMVVKCSR